MNHRDAMDTENHKEANLPVGTRVRFVKDLVAPPSEEHPALLYARKGELGEITGHGTPEGYWAITYRWPAPFGLAPGEFEVAS